MKMADMTRRLEQSMAEVKKLTMKIEVNKGVKSEQIAAATIDSLKEELERVDKRFDELKAKNQRMVQI